MKILNITKNTVLADDVEIASTALKRMIGLLGKDNISAGNALVLMPCDSIHTFFMRFPIDVLFVDKSNKIIKAVKAIRPFRLTRVYFRSNYCVELPVGSIDAANTAEGDVIRME